MTPAAALERGLQQLGMALAAETRERLLQYIALLSKWNRIYNLTAIRDPEAIRSRALRRLLNVATKHRMPAQEST